MARTNRHPRRLFYTPLAALTLLAALALAPEGARAQWATNGNDINNTNSGNVGVGTASPIGKLDVRQVGNGGAYATILTSHGTTEDTYIRGGSSSATIHIGDMVSTTSKLLLMENGGSVGIGTNGAAPAGLLQVRKAQNATTAVYVTNETDGTLAAARMLFGDHAANTDLFFTSYNTGFSGNGTLGLPAAGLAEFAANTNATGMVVGTRGAAPFVISTGAAERVRVLANGNVGVGTSSPNYRLVVGPEMQSGLVHAAMTVSKGANAGASIIVGSSGSTAAEFGWDHANTRSFFNSPGSAPMAFTQNGSNVRMLIDGSGNVGIGAPAAAGKRLYVSGDVEVTGNISAKYQDVAEWVPSRERLAAGTVVVLDTTASNHVVASTSAYDTGVAGVVSEQPGIILGEGGEGKVKVATTGRVKVRVDATRAPVRIGDLLVTGDGTGVAMKSEPIIVGGRRLHAPGTIVGKALEPLEKGVGEILVLLSLQ